MRLTVLLIAALALAMVAPQERFHAPFRGMPQAASSMLRGVRYIDLDVGRGLAITPSDKVTTVTIEYTAWLTNGTELECTGLRPAPFVYLFGYTQAVRGFDVGVAGMRVGGRRLFQVPADLAYAQREVPKVPRNSDLIFDVRVLAVRPAPPSDYDGW